MIRAGRIINLNALGVYKNDPYLYIIFNNLSYLISFFETVRALLLTDDLKKKLENIVIKCTKVNRFI